ncbi:Protein of unknown function [Pyronema omphalodes CBS 100304]|uniref:Uncharacterized protein n=1 Tax=Pyronema omphalodes (strain CBS 100304) TaxID=1076935 RepID=U4LBC1_PYROM|nr:Protein of unknown function [Pyronema omphalodes CBS 100304]
MIPEPLHVFSRLPSVVSRAFRVLPFDLLVKDDTRSYTQLWVSGDILGRFGRIDFGILSTMSIWHQ